MRSKKRNTSRTQLLIAIAAICLYHESALSQPFADNLRIEKADTMNFARPPVANRPRVPESINGSHQSPAPQNPLESLAEHDPVVPHSPESCGQRGLAGFDDVENEQAARRQSLGNAPEESTYQPVRVGISLVISERFTERDHGFAGR